MKGMWNSWQNAHLHIFSPKPVSINVLNFENHKRQCQY